jgi:hypothetical protein
MTNDRAPGQPAHKTVTIGGVRVFDGLQVDQLDLALVAPADADRAAPRSEVSRRVADGAARHSRVAR